MNIKGVVVILILIAVVIGGFLYVTDAGMHTRNIKTVVAFGDSLTQGYGSTKGNDYVSRLEKMIDRDVINMGVGGETTADALKRINDVIEAKPDLTIVFFGGNDVLRHVDKETMFANLEKIVTTLQAVHSEVVIVGIPGGIITDPLDTKFEELAEKYDIGYVPEFMGSLIRGRDHMFDSIHPNDAGYEIMTEKIYAVVKRYFK